MSYSLVIITRDRPEFLARLLKYYADCNLKAPIFIGDASHGISRDAVIQAVQRFNGALNIVFSFYDHHSPPVQRLREEYAKVDTEYAAWVGDDDFLVPEALDAAVDLLRRQPECAGVIGKGFAFSVEGDRVHGKVLSIGDYFQLPTAQECAVDRLIAQARQGAALTFSLRRTAVMREILQTITKFPWPDDIFGYLFFELLDGFLTAMSGKVVAIERLALARQIHSASTATAGWSQNNLYGLIIHPEWPKFIGAMTKIIAEELKARQPELTTDQVREATELALWIRIAALLNKGLSRELARGSPQHPGLRQRLRARLRLMFPQAGALVALARQRRRFDARDYQELKKILAVISH